MQEQNGKKLQKDTRRKRRVIDPVLINKISNFVIKSKIVSIGEVSGKHASVFKGHSLEFSHHREYSKGDDLRHIDWKIFGKKDKFYIKQFEAETNLRASILLDVSKSFDYKNKFEYASILSATLSFLFLVNQDNLDFILFSDRIVSNLPAESGKDSFYKIIRLLEEIELKGKTDISNVIMELGKMLKKRRFIIFITDLWDESNYIDAIKVLKAKKHDISVLHILHPDEVSPPEGYFRMIDIESKEKLFIDSKSYKKIYEKKLKEHIEYLQREFKLIEVDYFFMNLKIPLEKNLIYWLNRRDMK